MKERREGQPHAGRSGFRDRSTETDRTWRRRIGLAGAARRCCSIAMRGPASASESWPKTSSRRRCSPHFRRTIGSRTGRRCGPGSARFCATRFSITTAGARRADEPVRRSSGRPTRVRLTASSPAITSGRTPPLPGRRPKQALVDAEFWSVLDGCLGDLPRTLAQVFMLREIEQIEVESLCATLDLSPANLRVRLHRARLLLRDCLETRWFGSRSDEAPRSP